MNYRREVTRRHVSLTCCLLQTIPFKPLLLRKYHDILKQQYHKRFTLIPTTSPTPARQREQSTSASTGQTTGSSL